MQVTTKCRGEENVDPVNDLVLSQRDTPHTHRTVRKISCIQLRCYEFHRPNKFEHLYVSRGIA